MRRRSKHVGKNGNGNGNSDNAAETPQEQEQREAHEELQRALRAKQQNPKNN